MPLLEIPHGFRDFRQLVAPVDDGCDRSAFEEVSQELQMVPARPRNERKESLAHERGQDERLEETVRTLEPAAARSSDDDMGAARCQRAAALRQGMSARHVENEIVPLARPEEILLRVVGDVVRTERPHQFRVPRAADTRHHRAEHFPHLHREGPYTSRRAHDQDVLARSGLELSRSTLCEIMGGSAFLCEPLAALEKRRLFADDMIGADDTPVRLIDPSHPEGVRLARFWLYRGSEAAPYNVFDFHESRSRDGPRKFLGEYQGWVKVDAYGVDGGVYLGSSGISTATLQPGWYSQTVVQYEPQAPFWPTATT